MNSISSNGYDYGFECDVRLEIKRGKTDQSVKRCATIDDEDETTSSGAVSDSNECYSWIYVEQSDAATTAADKLKNGKKREKRNDNCTQFLFEENKKQTKAVPKEAVRRKYLKHYYIDQLKQNWRQWMLLIFKMSPRNFAVGDSKTHQKTTELSERQLDEIIRCLKSIYGIDYPGPSIIGIFGSEVYLLFG